MGTRSHLGYEMEDGIIYGQYMQYDGDPEGQGMEFYTTVVQGLATIHHTDKDGLPTPDVFKRIQCYLNERQYQTGHSVDSNFTCSRSAWLNHKINNNQEWQYLFTRAGDFIFASTLGRSVQVVIPWKLTSFLCHETHTLLGSDFSPQGLSVSSWWNAVKFSDYEENKRVISWRRDMALHIDEDLDYDSSKLLREMALKGVKISLPQPVLKVTYGESLSFPDQGENGWRHYYTLTAGTTLHQDPIITTMFGNRDDEPKRNQGVVQAVYLTGKKKFTE